MADLATPSETSQPSQHGSPPGNIKLAYALQPLHKGNDFSSITTLEIAMVAGVNTLSCRHRL
jgi:hypothetical protein